MTIRKFITEMEPGELIIPVLNPQRTLLIESDGISFISTLYEGEIKEDMKVLKMIHSNIYSSLEEFIRDTENLI